MVSGRTLGGIALACCLCLGQLAGRNGAAPDDPGGTSSQGHALIPVSGADGEFETTQQDGTLLYRGKRNANGDYPLYLYFRVPPALPRAKGAVYVEVTYVDVGSGPLSLQYNACDPADNYKGAEIGYGKFLSGRGTLRTAVFQLADPDFRRGQNLGA